MKILLSWLREFVPVEAAPEDLADVLSLRGFAVDALTTLGGGISGVIVGEVRAMREHPNADSLMLVRVADGTGERDIVCGARNYVVGDRIPLAAPGARLPGGIEIGARTVRGETSDGMLCSARELGIAEDHSGILLLDRDAPLGADVVSTLALQDVLFELDVTPNRPDALSVVGIAREVAAAYGLPLTIPSVDLREDGPPVATLASVEVVDARGCPRYLARVIEGVRVGPSPWWMRRRLLACGVRPISNVVDVTNHVLLERGHPLHAFDLDTLAGSRIVVRKPKRGETITTLDGAVRALATTDVAICDASGPVAVAGVMGGADSEVTDATTRILLESAYFDPLRIRPTANRLGMRSEASVRFERGADPDVVPDAAASAAALLASLAGGTVARGVIDVYPKPIRPKPIRLSVKRTGALIGAPQDPAAVAGWLTALGCSVETSGANLRVTPPSFRPDLRIEEDLVEEVARSYGYVNVPETLPAGSRTGGLTREQRLRRIIHGLLLGAGLSEAYSLSLLSPTLADRFGFPADHALRDAVALANPLSEEESRLRPGLLPGLLLDAERNAARRVLPVLLFEQGVVFTPAGSGEAPIERQQVAWILAGPADASWHAPGRLHDFYDAKGVAETILDGLGIQTWEMRAPEGDPWPADHALHPGRTAHVYIEGEACGVIGEIHPRICEELGLPARAAMGALDEAALMAAAGGGKGAEPARLPSVDRDIALIVPSSLTSASVAATLQAAAGDLLESMELFDVYRGAPVPEGHVSLAYRLSLRDPARTLTDADADAVGESLVRAAAEAGWTVRA